MMGDLLEVGEPAVLECLFEDLDTNDPSDPTTVTLTVTDPNGVSVTFTSPDAELENPSVGLWRHLHIMDVRGLWTYRFEGTGNVTAGDSGSVFVYAESEGLSAEGPCAPWCSWDQVLSCGRQSAALEALDLSIQAYKIAQASEVMYLLSERKFPGMCQTTRSVCMRCRGCATDPCCCRPSERLDLGPQWQVSGVLEVIADGEVLDPSAYRIENRRYIARLDGQTWPRCADLTDPEAFQITFTYGRPVPIGGQLGAAALARELAMSCTGGECQLPEHVTNITRDGITYTVLDSLRLFQEGRTGVSQADLWLGSLKVADMAPGGFFDPGSKAPTLHELG
jgi:hypothetical protein